VAWSPSSLLNAARVSFDDIEAYAYISGGELILRLEYELLVIRVPSVFGYEDLAAYVSRLGGDAFKCKRGLGFTLPSVAGLKIAFHARIIHREKESIYIAVEPRGVAGREKPPLC